MEQMMKNFISSTETRMHNQDASIKNLENQIGQLAKAMASRDHGTLPSDTEKNPKAQVKAIELRSGKKVETEQQEPQKTDFVIVPEKSAALKKAKLDAQFSKFLEVFKKLNINIPFVNALMQMPSYAKFLKEILSNKRKLEEHALVSLTENCSALVQNKIPPKQKDPGSFSIPCMISDVNFQKALCDLGASINLMSYSVFRKLGLGEPKPTRMSLQLADRSIKYSRGIIEDVLEPLEAALASPSHEDEIHIGKEEMTAFLNDNQPWRKGGKLRLEDLGDRKDLVLQKPSLEEPLTVELKPLPTHLKYVFLGDNNNLPVIISSSLTGTMEAKLLDFLKNHKSVFAWKVTDIKGINPSICMHKILMEENINPLVQPQRRLNPEMQEVVKAETIKILDADGYSGYNQISIAPEDQDKTTFTCPYDAPFDFDSHCLQALETLREILVTAPVLTSPNWDLPFEVMCDASDSAVGAVLGQRIDKVFRTIYYASKTLNEAQLNYTTTEKELLAVIFALDKFHSYLVLSKVTVYTD
ncbi:uncharacterized protein [Henckelia pumila]|uniref:uncharacterized protein n=1 Tax=Henckelia pumila TaxID=405737 RepID=UPI003C6E200A